jgi:hypothetical protein
VRGCLVFTDQLVRPLCWSSRPSAGDPRRALDALHAPHGRGARRPQRHPGGGARHQAAAASGEPTAETLAPAAIFAEEVQVTPSQISLLRETPLAPLTLQRGALALRTSPTTSSAP